MVVCLKSTFKWNNKCNREQTMVHKNCDTLCCSEFFVLRAHFLAAYDVVICTLYNFEISSRNF